jgi:hypothetical protein
MQPVTKLSSHVKYYLWNNSGKSNFNKLSCHKPKNAATSHYPSIRHTGIHAHLLAKCEMTIGGPVPLSFEPVIIQIADFVVHAFDIGRGVTQNELDAVLHKKHIFLPEDEKAAVFPVIFGHKQEYTNTCNFDVWRDSYKVVGPLWYDTPGFYGYEITEKMASTLHSLKPMSLLFYRGPHG